VLPLNGKSLLGFYPITQHQKIEKKKLRVPSANPILVERKEKKGKLVLGM
jgi:hypothetical protein